MKIKVMAANKALNILMIWLRLTMKISTSCNFRTLMLTLLMWMHQASFQRLFKFLTLFSKLSGSQKFKWRMQTTFQWFQNSHSWTQICLKLSILKKTSTNAASQLARALPLTKKEVQLVTTPSMKIHFHQTTKWTISRITTKDKKSSKNSKRCNEISLNLASFTFTNWRGFKNAFKRKSFTIIQGYLIVNTKNKLEKPPVGIQSKAMR